MCADTHINCIGILVYRYKKTINFQGEPFSNNISQNVNHATAGDINLYSTKQKTSNKLVLRHVDMERLLQQQILEAQKTNKCRERS